MPSHAHRGKGLSMSKTSSPMKYNTMDPTVTMAKFSGKPVRKKSRTRRGAMRSRDLANTITLAGVAVGNAKAKEHATVAGSTKPNGFRTPRVAAESSVGITVVAVPTAEKN